MSKPKSQIIKASEGESFWQPGVLGNNITIKISPWNTLKTQHTIFLHELPYGGIVAEHAHEINEEIFICLEGEGELIIDGNSFLFKKHDVAFIAPLSNHSIRTISKEPLKVMVIISPTGLEERLKLMGKPKITGEEAPLAFDSEIASKNTHGVI